MIHDISLQEKEVFVPPPRRLKNLQSGLSRKTGPTRAGKVKSIGKLSEVMKIQNEEERKWG